MPAEPLGSGFKSVASEGAHPPLRDFQTWMQTFIVSAGTPTEALRAAEDASGLDEGSAERLVKRSPTLDEMERLMIYRRMYPLRMEEALSMDFPVSRKLLGAKKFYRLVMDYVEAHPSRSWTLDHLGRSMVDFAPGHALASEYPGLADLVRLEQAVCEVFNELDSPTLTREDMAAVDPESWFDTRLECIPALRLLAVSSNANDLYKAHNQDRDLPAHSTGRRYLVVWRHQFQTWRMPLEEAAYEALSRLRAGEPLGEALGYALEHYEVEQGQVFDWFNSWVSEGYFRGLRGPEPTPIPDPIRPTQKETP